jgi:DNA mismatch repair protein PMS2
MFVLLSTIQAYALIAKGVRFGCTNTTGKNVKSVVLKTQGNDSLKDNIITVLGMNTFNCLEPMALCISESCKVEGFLSKPGLGNGRNLGDRQYFFVNGRPVDMPKVGKLVNELYRSANSKQYPIAILNFTVPTKAYDVNVTPDKRKIFFSEETSFLQALREGLQQIYSPDSASYAVNEFMQPAVKEDCYELCSSHNKSPTVMKPSSLNDTIPREEHYTDCKTDSISRDKNNTDRNNKSIPQNEHKEKHDTTDSKKASESDDDDLFSHVEEGLIRENDDGLMGQEFTLRAHKSLKGDKSGRQPASTHSALRNQATLVSRSIESGGSANKYSSDSSRHVQSTLNNFVAVSKRKRDDIITALSEVPVLRNQAPQCKLKTSNTETNDLTPTRSYLHLDQINETSELSEIDNLQQLNPDSIYHKSVNLPSFKDDTTDREPNTVSWCAVKHSKDWFEFLKFHISTLIVL